MGVYIAIFVAVIVLYLIYRLFLVSIIKIFKYFCKGLNEKYLETGAIENDFYACASFKTLRDILHETKQEIKVLKPKLDTGSY
jgi:hypothetical protein